MNWEAIGAVGEILGALAVFISLLYLATQIRASTNQAKAVMVQNISREFGEIHNAIMSNPQLAEVFARISDADNLTAAEKVQVHSLANRIALIYVSAATAFENHQIPEDYYRSLLQDAQAIEEQYPRIARLIGEIMESHSEMANREIFSRFRNRGGD